VATAITVPNPRALSLDGTNGVTLTASAATSALDQAAETLTVAAWVRRPVTGTEVTIFQNGAGAQSWYLAITGDNRLRFQYGASSFQTAPVPALNPLNTWVHVAAAFSRSGNGTLRIFVNGAVVLQGSPNPVPAAITPTGNKAMGARDGNNSRFNGLIDDLRLYNRVLTNAEVNLLAQGKGCVFDGLSWATALRELQCGLAQVAANGQVWVADGLYLPSYNRTISFPPARNMTIYGGFAGSETSPAQRPIFNPQAPLTTLTGDVLGNDTGFTNNGENTNCVIAPTTGIALTLDGLAVRGGNASTTPFTGGAVRFPTSGALRVSNAAFVNNRANNQGGAIQSSSRVTVTASLFFSNTSGNQGGAIRVDNISPGLTAISSTFASNVATSAGGAVYTANPAITNSTFTANRSTNGGAVHSTQNGATITGSNFAGNSATSGGGALFIASGAGAVTGSSFSNNSSGSRGGAVRNDSVGNLSVFSTAFAANTATIDGGAVSSGGALVVNGSQFTNNAVLGANSNSACNPICNQGQGGAVYGASAVTLQASTLTTNTAKLQGGAIYVAGALNITGGSASGNRAGLPQDAGNPNRGEGGAIYGAAGVIVSGMTLTKNEAARQGGAIFAVGALNVTSALLQANTANGATLDSDQGGALFARGQVALTDATLQGNSADVAAALFQTTTVGIGPALGITATRIVSNSALVAGGAVFADANSAGRPVAIAGSLFAGNTAATGFIGRDLTLDNTTTNVRNTTFADVPDPAPALAASNSTVTVRNSLFRGYAPGVLAAFSGASIDSNFNLFTVAPSVVPTGSNSIVADPLFVNPGAGDYRLLPLSPAVDAGNDAALPASLTTDLDALPRQVDGNPTRPALVDMGAFEMQRLAPAAVPGGPYNGVEGSPVALDASASTGTPPFTFGWDCGNDGTVDVQGNAPTGLACTYADDGPYVARLVITDSVGFTSTSTAPVAVANVAPLLTPPAAGQFTGVTLNKSFDVGSFADAGVLDFPWDVGVNWGDGNVSLFSVNVQGALPPQTHTFAVAGTKTVTVTLTDQDGGADVATFALTVDPAPVAAPDNAFVAAGGSLLIDVLGNDSGVGIALSSVGAPSLGSAAIEAGKIRYTAPATGSGNATFTYTITDRNGATTTANVSVAVDPKPVAVADEAETQAGGSVLIDVLGNDSGAGLTISAVTVPTLGSAAIEAGKIRYTAPTSGSGNATFTYTITDRNGVSTTATVTVTVNGDAPTADFLQYLPSIRNNAP
jgi:predicted outer membrane repeat protein